MGQMQVTFDHIGLTFEAEVDYEPYVAAQLYGPPENCSPEEGGTAEITALTCDGKDALFLVQSEIGEDLNSAAYDACVTSVESDRQQAEEDRAQARAEDRRGY